MRSKSTQQANSGKTVESGNRSPARSRTQAPAADQEALLELQHSAGNAAVSRSLRAGLPQHVDDVLRSPGQTLTPATRAEMEAKLGHDFGLVRVHADRQADESAQALQARAYTVGRHVVFKDGAYNPGATAGKQLLTHELAHVVQQSRGGPPPTLEPTSPLEQAAARSAAAAQAGGAVTVEAASGVGVARDEDDEPKKKRRRRGEPRGRTPDRSIKDPTERRGKHILEEFEERAHDPSQEAELEEERATKRTRRSEGSRHRTRALDIEEHHAFPKFLGGNRIQKYIKLTNELHYLYHEELYHLLESEFKQRGVLPKDAGRGSRRAYGRIFARLSEADQQAILDKIVAHAEEFDARYRAADPAKKHAGYPDKRQRLAAAVRRGIKEARAELEAQRSKKGPGTPARKRATQPPVPTEEAPPVDRPPPVRRSTGTPSPKTRAPVPKRPSRSVRQAIIQREKLFASLRQQNRRAVAFNNRLRLYGRVAGGLFTALELLGAVEDMMKIAAHGTVLPEAQEMADHVREQARESKTWAEEVTDEISLLQVLAEVGMAIEDGDKAGLFDLSASVGDLGMALLGHAEKFEDLARDLNAHTELLRSASEVFKKLVSVPQGVSTAPNASQLAMHISLQKLSGATGNAGEYYGEAGQLLRFYAEALNTYAYQANQEAWALVFEEIAIRQQQIDERERQQAEQRQRELERQQKRPAERPYPKRSRRPITPRRRLEE